MDSENPTPQNSNGVAGKPFYPVVTSDNVTSRALEASNVAPTQLPKPDINESIDTLHNKGLLSNIRTYESDIAEAMKDNQGSVVKVAAAEKRREQKRADTRKEIAERPKEPEKPYMKMMEVMPQEAPQKIAEVPQKPAQQKRSLQEDPRMAMFVLGLSGLLILGGIAVIVAIFIVLRNQPQKLAPVKVDTTQIIATETAHDIILDASSTQSIISILATQKANTQGSAGSAELLVRLNFLNQTTVDNKKVSTPVDSQTFATLLGVNMPGALIRSLDTNYTSGLFIHDSQAYPFFIFKITSYENAFGGMLDWEQTIRADLSSILPVTETPIVATSTATTTTKKSTSKASTTQPVAVTVIPQGFQDQTINNKNIRVAEDANGTPVILYSFPDKETLIITTDAAALREILARLATSKFVQ